MGISIRDWVLGVWIRHWDWGFKLGIVIRDWGWELGLGIGIRNWDSSGLRLGIRIGDCDSALRLGSRIGDLDY